MLSRLTHVVRVCTDTPLQIIEKNTRVRLKIVGTRVDATEIVGLFYLPACIVQLHLHH